MRQNRLAFAGSRRAILTLILLVAGLASDVSATQRQDTIVKLAGTPRYPGGATLTEELRIGVVDGAPEYTFTSVTDIVVTTTGDMFVLDAPWPGTPALRLYDSKGNYVRTVGRIGDGPGEFRRPGSIALTPQGQLLLLDGPRGRMNVYTLKGNSAGSFSIPRVQVTLNAGDRMWVDVSGTIAIRINPPDAISGKNPTSILRLRPNGTVIDTLSEPLLPEIALPSVTARGVRPDGMRTRVTVGVPYSPAAFWAWSPLGYFVTGVSNRYAIDLRLPSSLRATAPLTWRLGDPVLSIRRDVRPISIAAAERAEHRNHREGRLNRIGGTQSGKLPDVPLTKPAFNFLTVGADGRIWVTVSTPSERYDPPPVKTLSGATVAQVGWREPVLLDVFEPDGSYVGQVPLPFGFRPLTFSGNHIWGYSIDEFDVQHIKRFRVDWRSSSNGEKF